MKTSVFLILAVAVFGSAGIAHESAANALAPVKAGRGTPVKGRDWTHAVTPTRDGGYMLGNPNAKVKLVEFGSLTCPHCRRFDAEGAPQLLAYVKTGEVSWEFRNYVRDSFDITAALIARCNGSRSFFELTRALFKDQQAWEAKIETVPQDQLTPLQDLPPERQFVALAKISGLQQWASAHGLPISKSSQCLSNARSVKQLVDMAGDATTQFPEFKGTPAFVINGKLLDKTATWDTLEPQLKAALGTRG